MAKVISMLSFRRGTGKSTLAANISVLLACAGQRVGLIDANLESPSIHMLFGLEEERIDRSLNDYLWGECQIEQAAYRVTPSHDAGLALDGEIFLVPSSTDIHAITRLLRHGYDGERLNAGMSRLAEVLKLDVLVLDTMAGVTEETLIPIATSDALAIIMHLDHQDYQGTGLLVDLAHRLETPQVMLIINEVSPTIRAEEAQAQAEQAYNCPVAAVLPYSDEIMAMASKAVFALHHPDHPITLTFKGIAERLTGVSSL